MNTQLHKIILRANTALFAQKVCTAIRDMTTNDYQIQPTSLNKGLFTFPGGVIAFVHFAGSVQGDYILACDEQTPIKILNKWNDGMSLDEMRENRQTHGSFMKELLNIACGMALPELEKKYGTLTVLPPALIYGEIEFPEVASGNVNIESKLGTIQCTLSLNMTSLRSLKAGPQ